MTATTADATTATATAPIGAEIPAGAESESQRVGVHAGTPAGVHAPARTRGRARARARGAAARGGTWWSHFSASLRHDEAHGAPWDEQPMSLVALRQVMHTRAAVHTALPLAKELYLFWAYVFIIPVTVVAYCVLWVLQAPPRTVIAAVVLAALHHWHPITVPAFIHAIPFVGFIV